MHHHKFMRPEKDVSCDSTDFTKLGNQSCCINTNVNTITSRCSEGKSRKKTSNCNVVYQSKNLSTVYVKENDEKSRTLDVILNFEWRKKKSSNYVSAYFTDSDLNQRKMFHESKSSRAVNAEVPKDNAINHKSRFKHKNCLISNAKHNKDNELIDKGKKELEELFRATDTDFKSYCQEDDIFKDLDRYFKGSNHQKKKKSCFYRLNKDHMYKKTTLFSPEVKCSNVNLLIKKQDSLNHKINKFNSDIKSSINKAGNDFIFKTNLTDGSSIITNYQQKKMLNENDTVKFKTGVIKSKHSLVNLRVLDGQKDYYKNDNSVVVSFNKNCQYCSNPEKLSNNRSTPLELNTNGCEDLKNVYYSNYIHQNPDKLEKSRVVMNETSLSNCTSCYNNNFNQKDSNSSVLDYSISRTKQDGSSKSFKKKSVELPSDYALINHNLIGTSCSSLRKPSCEVVMKRINNQKRQRMFGNNKFLNYKSSRKYLNPKLSKHSHDFEEACKSYLTDKNLRDSKVRYGRTQSEFIPATWKQSMIHKVNRPNSIEKDILLKNFNEIVKNSSKIYNYHLPFTMKMIESHQKCEFTEENLVLCDNLKIEERFFKLKANNDVAVKVSIPNMYIIKGNNKDNLHTKQCKIENCPFNLQQQENLTLQPNNKMKKSVNSNYEGVNCSKGMKLFNSVNFIKNTEENCEINKSFKNPNFLKPNIESIKIDNEDIKTIFENFKGGKCNDRSFNNSVLKKSESVHELSFKNNEKKFKNNTSIEVIFPIQSKMLFSCSHTSTNMTSSCSSKVGFCKSGLSQSLRKTKFSNKTVTSKKKVIFDENINSSLNDTEFNSVPLTACSINNPKNDIKLNETPMNDVQSNYAAQNNDLNSKIYEQVVLKCTDMLNSSKFKLEIENIIKKYLEKKIIVNWIGSKKFNVLIFPDDEGLKNNPEKIIETLKSKHMQRVKRKIKSCSYKFHKIQASCKSLISNEQKHNNENQAENVNKDIQENNTDSLELKEVNEKVLETEDTSNANEINSLSINSVSKSKVRKRSVTYYSKLSCHSIKINKLHKPKSKKHVKNKTKLHKHECFKSNVVQKKKSENKDIKNNGEKAEKQDESKIFDELNEFKTLLTEVEKKQDSILSFLNQDPCGMLFTFPSSTSMLRKCNRIRRFKIPFQRLSEKMLFNQQTIKKK